MTPAPDVSAPRTALVTGGVSGLGDVAAQLRSDGLRIITVDVAGSADELVDVMDEAATTGVLANTIAPAVFATR